jgi:xanthine dehydrogenase accessory factor
MRERNQILDLWRRLIETNESAVLATVVRTEGSSYRLPGARLLLAQNGQRVGGVSGGCLEDDIVRKAWWLTEAGPVVRKYDTTPDGEIATEGYGLGCNGVIYVLLERITPWAASVLPVLEAVDRERRPAFVAHVISPAVEVGGRLIIDPMGIVSHNLVDPDLAERLVAEAKTLNTSTVLSVSPTMHVFFEKVEPATRLMIFGAGGDAVPVAALANYLGWRVSVFDGRAHYAKPGKFPGADEVVVRQAGAPAPKIDEWTVAVLMTHSYSQDLDVLRTLCGQPLRYLGVLGPRKRSLQLLDELSTPERNSLTGLRTPMGLDLGGDGPEPVALAVVAEIQSVLQGRTGGALSNRSAPIHSEVSSSNEKAWVRSIVCA